MNVSFKVMFLINYLLKPRCITDKRTMVTRYFFSYLGCWFLTRESPVSFHWQRWPQGKKPVKTLKDKGLSDLPGTSPLTCSCPFGPCNICTFCTLPAVGFWGLIWAVLAALKKGMANYKFTMIILKSIGTCRNPVPSCRYWFLCKSSFLFIYVKNVS